VPQCLAGTFKFAKHIAVAQRLVEFKPQEQCYWRLVVKRKVAQDISRLEFWWLLKELRVRFPRKRCVHLSRPASSKGKTWEQLSH
jgi:hypothetical protein